MWEWEHKDGSVDKEKGAGQWVWGWEGRGGLCRVGRWGLKW